MRKLITATLSAAVFTVVATYSGIAQQNQMSFFVTSAGPGNGANLGGLAGADKQCQTLAAAAGAGNRTWRAYLSAAAASGQPAVNAKDRIGKGPWYNQKGVMIAKSVEDLHSEGNNLKKDTALTEIKWAQWGCGVHLVVLPSPYRSVMGSLLDYIEELLQKDPDGWVTVVIPEILPARWWQNILHNQRALMLKAALLFKERVILTDVPFHLER